MTDLELTVEREIGAAREDVFAAWLDPEMLARFMMPAQDMSVPKATTDAAEGGRFEIVMLAGDREMPHRGTYREIVPHERIVFTWESPFSQDDSEVTLRFADAAGGGTRVTLHHRRFVDKAARDSHAGGWTRILEVLDSEFQEAGA